MQEVSNKLSEYLEHLLQNVLRVLTSRTSSIMDRHTNNLLIKILTKKTDYKKKTHTRQICGHKKHIYKVVFVRIYFIYTYGLS